MLLDLTAADVLLVAICNVVDDRFINVCIALLGWFLALTLALVAAIRNRSIVEADAAHSQRRVHRSPQSRIVAVLGQV